MKVQDVMTRHVVTCRADADARTALQLLWKHDVGLLPVVDGTDVVGVVTDRDIAMACCMKNERPSDVKVDAITSHRLFSVTPDDTIERAEQVMQDHQVRRVPVIEEGRLVGMVTLADLAHEKREVPPADVARTLGVITEPRAPVGAP